MAHPGSAFVVAPSAGGLVLRRQETPEPEPPKQDTLTALSPAEVWVGVKNSDAVGLRLDLKAEVYLNATKIGEGQPINVASGSSGFTNARLHAIPLTLLTPAEVAADVELELTLSVRRTCAGGGHNSGTPRLWYNDSQANSRFSATIAEAPSTLFLRGGFALNPVAGASKKSIDVPTESKASCPNRPFKPFGTRSLTYRNLVLVTPPDSPGSEPGVVPLWHWRRGRIPSA